MKALLVLISLAIVIFDGFLFLRTDKGGDVNFIFNLAYSIIFILGAVIAFAKLKTFKEDANMKLALRFFSFGLVFYAIGLFIWTYFNLFLRTEIPYPSLADAAFLLYYPGVILGTYFLVKSFGGKFTGKLIFEGVLTFLVFFGILYLFLNQTSQGIGVSFGARFLNILYPIADSFLTALAITILRTEKGIADHPNILYFVFAFIVLAAADTIFSFRSSNGIYWNGDISDFLFAVSGFLTAWGILTL
jgi:hypothetical protein